LRTIVAIQDERSESKAIGPLVRSIADAVAAPAKPSQMADPKRAVINPDDAVLVDPLPYGAAVRISEKESSIPKR
jgi:hypothetical protein